jgi:ATP-dependent DNA helicase DinG
MGQYVDLHYSPVNVGVMLRAILWHGIPSVVLTSATLSDSGGFSFIRGALGIGADYAKEKGMKEAVERVIGSPFDFEHNAALYAPDHIPAPPTGQNLHETQRHADRLAQEILRVVNCSKGRAFLLFTSRKMLDLVYDRIRFAVDWDIHRQGDLPPTRLLEAFRKSGGLLMGLQTFWEGVDVAGAALSCVVIDRIPFAVPESPLNRALEAMIKARGGSSFNELMLPVAQMRLKQGFGRLIRSKEDRGVVAILDSRLITKSYGKTFIKYLPPASRVHNMEDVRKFWQLGNERAN